MFIALIQKNARYLSHSGAEIVEFLPLTGFLTNWIPPASYIPGFLRTSFPWCLVVSNFPGFFHKIKSNSCLKQSGFAFSNNSPLLKIGSSVYQGSQSKTFELYK